MLRRQASNGGCGPRSDDVMSTTLEESWRECVFVGAGEIGCDSGSKRLHGGAVTSTEALTGRFSTRSLSPGNDAGAGAWRHAVTTATARYSLILPAELGPLRGTDPPAVGNHETVARPPRLTSRNFTLCRRPAKATTRPWVCTLLVLIAPCAPDWWLPRWLGRGNWLRSTSTAAPAVAARPPTGPTGGDSRPDEYGDGIPTPAPGRSSPLRRGARRTATIMTTSARDRDPQRRRPRRRSWHRGVRPSGTGGEEIRSSSKALIGLMSEVVRRGHVRAFLDLMSALGVNTWKFAPESLAASASSASGPCQIIDRRLPAGADRGLGVGRRSWCSSTSSHCRSSIQRRRHMFQGLRL